MGRLYSRPKSKLILCMGPFIKDVGSRVLTNVNDVGWGGGGGGESVINMTFSSIGRPIMRHYY